MKQRLYDSQQRAVVDFEPRVPGQVGMYVCGPTVQSAPHIGHLRSALVYDQIRRWLSVSGNDVTLIRNVTDIDDKILERARAPREAAATSADDDHREEWWALAYRVEREFTAAYDAIGILAPTYEPRATANIQEMLSLIGMLIERGHAYPALDGTASVYFDTETWPEYGALTRQSLDQMADAADTEPVGKKHPSDFALWKAHRESEPESASWPSPWGRGRPGWHIECSAMATRYLGTSFDIHGGGLDLRFPHHENELAQSRAAGHAFATYWLHNGLVNTDGQKMSKSTGNSLFAADLLTAARPVVLRYFLGSAHYRSVLEFSEQSLAEAAAAYERIEGFWERATEVLGSRIEDPTTADPLLEHLPEPFVAAMLDDFAVPQALAAVHQAVRRGNQALAANDEAELRDAARELSAMLDVLGLHPDRFGSNADGGDAAHRALETLVDRLIAGRQEARAAKDYPKSDEIRDYLAAAGIALEDTPDGTRWSLT